MTDEVVLSERNGLEEFSAQYHGGTSYVKYRFSFVSFSNMTILLRVCDDIMVDRILILVAGYIGTIIIDWESTMTNLTT
jgi:hypothetical protein